MIKTVDEIKENLVFAANVMRRLPPVKVQGYVCSWPKFCSVDSDLRNQSDVWFPPLPNEVVAMEEILEWLKFISIEDRRIVWLRSCGMGWKRLAQRYLKSRSTVIRQYNNAILHIQQALQTSQDEQKSLIGANTYPIRHSTTSMLHNDTY